MNPFIHLLVLPFKLKGFKNAFDYKTENVAHRIVSMIQYVIR